MIGFGLDFVCIKGPLKSQKNNLVVCVFCANYPGSAVQSGVEPFYRMGSQRQGEQCDAEAKGMLSWEQWGQDNRAGVLESLKLGEENH